MRIVRSNIEFCALSGRQARLFFYHLARQIFELTTRLPARLANRRLGLVAVCDVVELELCDARFIKKKTEIDDKIRVEPDSFPHKSSFVHTGFQSSVHQSIYDWRYQVPHCPTQSFID